jgi:hypothetical protein
MVPDAWEEAVRVVGTLEVGEYRSVVVDPLLEWNVSAQAYSKAKAGVGVDDLMHVKIWGPTQERCAIVLRRLRNYRDAGVFVYLTAQEMIDKDYIEDPRSAKGGVAPQEPYSIRGTAAVPGQLTATVQHLADLMFHVKSVGGRASWVTQPEVISPGSGAVWEAKDRYGRLADKYVYPNFRTLLKSFYGSKVVEIYGQGPTDRQTDGLEPAAAASTA